jgi:hypothetical protein
MSHTDRVFALIAVAVVPAVFDDKAGVQFFN